MRHSIHLPRGLAVYVGCARRVWGEGGLTVHVGDGETFAQSDDEYRVRGSVVVYQLQHVDAALHTDHH